MTWLNCICRCLHSGENREWKGGASGGSNSANSIASRCLTRSTRIHLPPLTWCKLIATVASARSVFECLFLVYPHALRVQIQTWRPRSGGAREERCAGCEFNFAPLLGSFVLPAPRAAGSVPDSCSLFFFPSSAPRRSLLAAPRCKGPPGSVAHGNWSSLPLAHLVASSRRHAGLVRHTRWGVRAAGSLSSLGPSVLTGSVGSRTVQGDGMKIPLGRNLFRKESAP